MLGESEIFPISAPATARMLAATFNLLAAWSRSAPRHIPGPTLRWPCILSVDEPAIPIISRHACLGSFHNRGGSQVMGPPSSKTSKEHEEAHQGRAAIARPPVARTAKQTSAITALAFHCGRIRSADQCGECSASNHERPMGFPGPRPVERRTRLASPSNATDTGPSRARGILVTMRTHSPGCGTGSGTRCTMGSRSFTLISAPYRTDPL